MTDHAYGIRPAGYRLPDDTRIGRVRLQVSDLARSLVYYQTVIGFALAGESNGVAELTAADGGPVLLELREKKGVAAVPRRGRIGLYHFAILLPDRASLGSFLAHLASIGAHPGMSDHLVSEALYLGDPDGLGIEVYADRPRESWSHAQRQLAMASDPLDVRSLLEAGAGREWRGLPRGTTIGHVHLYVNDIEEAERFYHAALGFDKVVWSYPGALFLSAGGYHHHLGTNTWAVGAPIASDDDARLIDWELVLPNESDVGAAADSLARGGHAVSRAGADAHVADPWGTRLRLTTGDVRR